MRRRGDKDHVTETYETRRPHIIVHVATAAATLADVETVPARHHRPRRGRRHHLIRIERLASLRKRLDSVRQDTDVEMTSTKSDTTNRYVVTEAGVGKGTWDDRKWVNNSYVTLDVFPAPQGS